MRQLQLDSLNSYRDAKRVKTETISNGRSTIQVVKAQEWLLEGEGLIYVSIYYKYKAL